MEIRVVDYVLAVAENGSLRAAAQALGITQPALTKAVQRMEDEGGVRLFDRSGRGVQPTVYGEAMLRHAQSSRLAARLQRRDHGLEEGDERRGADWRWSVVGTCDPETAALLDGLQRSYRAGDAGFSAVTL